MDDKGEGAVLREGTRCRALEYYDSNVNQFNVRDARLRTITCRCGRNAARAG